MPLQVGQEAVFCLDFTRAREGDFVPHECTIPELVYRRGASDRVAFLFDSENVTLTFGKVKSEMEQLAAGLLNTGLKPSDRILICGNNHSLLLLSVLAAARAGLIFSIASPNFTQADQLRHLLELGEFRALIMFGPSDRANELLIEICPELRQTARGHTKSKALPELTHVIYADEDHKHAGTFTLSELFGKSSQDRIAKLPIYAEWNCHTLCAIQFTSGSTGPPKAIGLSHYQLINGCRIAANAIGIKRETVLCCALPLFRIPVFCLVGFTPFLLESQSIFSEPSPLPKLLFQSINKYQCTNLLSNAAALRLLLRTAVLTHAGTKLPTVDTVILVGERVGAELLTSIETIMKNAKRIAVGMLSSELGAVPILSDNTTNLVKAVGKVLDGFQVDVAKIDKLTNNGHMVGELRLKPLAKTKFLGYGPKFDTSSEWVDTGDVVCIHKDGNIEIITQHKHDLVYDRNDRLVEHWKIERLLAQNDQIRGVQVVQEGPGSPVVAVIVPKSMKCVPQKSELITLCRENNLCVPDQFALTVDFPRVNTKIQKYKIREQLRAKRLTIY